MLKEFEVPDGKTGFLYLVDDANADIAIECFASKVPIEYVLDDDGKATTEETNTASNRARIAVSGMIGRQINKYRTKKAANAVQPIINIVS